MAIYRQLCMRNAYTVCTVSQNFTRPPVTGSSSEDGYDSVSQRFLLLRSSMREDVQSPSFG
jgi:hypothetical protein